MLLTVVEPTTIPVVKVFALIICSTRLLSSVAGDGVLNFTEFIDLMVNDKPELEVDLELIEAFRCFDTGDTGMIGDQLLTRLKL